MSRGLIVEGKERRRHVGGTRTPQQHDQAWPTTATVDGQQDTAFTRERSGAEIPDWANESLEQSVAGLIIVQWCVRDTPPT